MDLFKLCNAHRYAVDVEHFQREYSNFGTVDQDGVLGFL